MLLQFCFHLLFILWPLYPILATALDHTVIAKPDCDSTCGSVDIPYPFGMHDPKCYADKWFEIECRNSSLTYSRPFLKSINLEVSEINPSMSIIQVNNPIQSSNCRNKTSLQAIELRGSPFVYSQDFNKFVAIGCNKLALLVSNGAQVGGCVSICNSNDDSNSDDLGSTGCIGRHCCETSLPLYLSEYNTTVEDLQSNSSKTDQCVYAMIIEGGRLQEYFYNGTGEGSLGYIKELDHVAAVLDWEIVNSTVQLPNGFCSGSNITAPGKKQSGRRCQCSVGFYGNPYLFGGCIEIPGYFSGNKRTRTKWAIVGVSSSLGSIILLLGLWWLYKIARRRAITKRKEKFFKQNGGLLLQKRLSSGEVNVDRTNLFSLKDLEKATDHFNVNRVLGKGGQGTVYKGMLVDGKIVAIKKFRVQGKVEEFINEFLILSQINHRNVVKLLGCCLETEVPLLVYEFIPNGNLFQYLHQPNEDLPMTWDMRVRIAAEVAGALFYLHSAASQPIYHRDVKSTNILLDEKYRAKVADFGTSRMVSIEDTHLTTQVQGTFGYLDPEYFHTSQFTEKSDVYSFGVVLVELLTGQKPISSMRPEQAVSLASYFVVSLEEDRLFEIIDKRVMKEGKKEHIMTVANLANRCLSLNGKNRPSMKEVTIELERIQKMGKKPDAQQHLEEIDLVAIECHPWAEHTTSSGPVLINTTSSSSEATPFVLIN